MACGRRRQRHFPHSSTPLAQLSKLLAHLRRCELFVHIQIATPEPLKRLLLQVRIDYAMSFGRFLIFNCFGSHFFKIPQALSRHWVPPTLLRPLLGAFFKFTANCFAWWFTCTKVMPICQRSIMLHHQGRPSWWNMRWQRSIYQGRGREDVNIPPHPTPPDIYIYIKRKNVPKRTGHPSRREQLPSGVIKHWWLAMGHSSINTINCYWTMGTTCLSMGDFAANHVWLSVYPHGCQFHPWNHPFCSRSFYIPIIGLRPIINPRWRCICVINIDPHCSCGIPGDPWF